MYKRPPWAVQEKYRMALSVRVFVSNRSIETRGEGMARSNNPKPRTKARWSSWLKITKPTWDAVKRADDQRSAVKSLARKQRRNSKKGAIR